MTGCRNGGRISSLMRRSPAAADCGFGGLGWFRFYRGGGAIRVSIRVTLAGFDDKADKGIYRI